MIAAMDEVPPFHTLVGPGQFARQRSSEEAQPGGEQPSEAR